MGVNVIAPAIIHSMRYGPPPKKKNQPEDPQFILYSIYLSFSG
ncbi:hypothetical protein Mpsy_0595 [Methanolobus psychrophilus R15]|nr:hypothetical protein Mpsy_0595 [Methanolobus psychrophilus R15]